MFNRDLSQPVEYAIEARQFREQHHAGQEQIHIGSRRDRAPCQSQGNKPKPDQQQRSATDPIHLGDSARPHQHQHNAGDDHED